MPQEVINIKRFGGLYFNPQQEDIPLEASAYSVNVDPHAVNGRLTGVKVSGDAITAAALNIPDVYEADWLQNQISNETCYDLIYIDKDDNDITAITDFYSTRTITITSSTDATPIVVTAAAHHLHHKVVNETTFLGQKVTITGHEDNVAANGNHFIKAISVNTFELYSDEALTSGVAGTGAGVGSGGTVSTPAFLDLVNTGITPYCVKTFNKEAHIGCGSSYDARLAYRLLTTKVAFNAETILPGIKEEYDYCYNTGGALGFTVTTATLSGAAGGLFQEDILYKWGVSAVYDGLQESNLVEGDSDTGNTGGETTATLTITAAGLRTAGAGGDGSFLDSRITGIKIYRAESSDDTETNLGLYRLVETIDITSATWSASTNDYTYSYEDDGTYPEGGATYEEETGIPHTLSRQSVRYKINEVGGGYHWTTVGKPTGQGGDWTNYIFRSKKFRPSMFDWTSDFLVLPEIPTALAWFNNYLYAFSINKLYKINPELLIIEDVFEGVGCSNRQAVCVTEFGMFFCNSEGAYRLANNQVDVISDPIYATNSSISGAYGWKDFADYSLYNVSSDIQKMMVHYLAEKRCVLFIGQFYGAVKAAAFVFYLPTQEWYWWDFSIASIATDSGAFTGKDGEVYYSNQTATYQLLGGATYTNFDWVSKEFNGGEPSQNKSWNKLVWDVPQGTVVCKYNTNGSTPLSGTTATSGSWINTYKKTFQFYLDCTGGSSAETASVDSVDIIVRRLIGKR